MANRHCSSKRRHTLICIENLKPQLCFYQYNAWSSKGCHNFALTIINFVWTLFTNDSPILCILFATHIPRGQREAWCTQCTAYHPSIAAGAWYWLNCIWQSGWLCITSRFAFKMQFINIMSAITNDTILYTDATGTRNLGLRVCTSYANKLI